MSPESPDHGDIPLGRTPRPGTVRPFRPVERPADSSEPVEHDEHQHDTPAPAPRPAQQPVPAVRDDEAPRPVRRPRADKPAQRRPKPVRPKLKLPSVRVLLKGAAAVVLLALLVLAVTSLSGPVMIISVIAIVVAALFVAKPDVIDIVLPAKHTPTGPVPKLGFRGLAWKVLGSWLYARFGWDWLKRLSLREREVNADNELWEHRYTQKIVAFVNSKGGAAKTALTTWLSAIYSLAIRRHIVALDANENAGHTAKRFGLLRRSEAGPNVRSKTKRGTIELREYLQLVEEGQLDDEERFNDVVQWDRDSGVSVIASEATSNQSFTAHSFMKGLRRAKQNSHSVFCDLGNGIMREANIGSVHMADTLVFPGNVNMADSLDDISNTKMRYADLGVPQKVQNGIVVIVGARLRDREKYAERFDNPVERTFVVPFNRYMKQGKPVSIPKLPRRIRVILKEILVAIVKAERGQDAGINELIDHAHDYLHI